MSSPVHSRTPLNRTDHRLGVGVYQYFVRIEPVPGSRAVRPGDPVAVDLPGPYVREISVPNVIRVFRKDDAMTFPICVDGIKETELVAPRG